MCWNIRVQGDMNGASAPAVIDESSAFDRSDLIRVANVEIETVVSGSRYFERQTSLVRGPRF